MPTKKKTSKKTSAARKAYQAKWIAAKRKAAREAKATPAVVLVVVAPAPAPRKATLQADGVYRLGECPKCIAAGGTCAPCRMEMADGRTPEPREIGDASDYAYGM